MPKKLLLKTLLAILISTAAAHCSVYIKILALNDFHGHLSSSEKMEGRPIGGAAVLAAYLRRAQEGVEDRTFIVHAGDMTGASPPESGLLQDEPAIMFLNLLANGHCSYEKKDNTRCNMAGILGNHEFDGGFMEVLRVLNGGNHEDGPFLENPYRGARFPVVCANAVFESTDDTFLRPYVIKEAEGVRIAFIGAVTAYTAVSVRPGSVRALKFADPASAINKSVKELKAKGVRAIAVVIHEGGIQESYPGKTDSARHDISGAIIPIINALDPEVDIVITGHRHQFMNALVKRADGSDMLVTQAFSNGLAFADIDLELSEKTGDVVKKTAEIRYTWGDTGPGIKPDSMVAALVAQAEKRVATQIQRVVGNAQAVITRAQNSDGESAQGNLIADAQRSILRADFAFTNPGGIRTDIKQGDITWGDLFSIQPFRNDMIILELNGSQILELLNQQWAGQPYPRILQVSGLRYTWDPGRPENDRVQDVKTGKGYALVPGKPYKVAVNAFLAEGGDGFSVFLKGGNRYTGLPELNALADYIRNSKGSVNASIEGRIKKIPGQETPGKEPIE